jgi:Colicin V production protein
VTLLIDVVAVVILLVNAVVGWRSGVIGRCIVFAGLYGGVAGATFMGNGLADYVHGRGTSGSLYASAWAFVVVLAVVVVLVEILVALYGDHLHAVSRLAFDRTAGMVAGVVVGVLEVAVLCLVAVSVGEAQPGGAPPGSPATTVADSVRNGIVSGRVLSVEPGVRALFSAALPHDLAAHLAELTSS